MCVYAYLQRSNGRIMLDFRKFSISNHRRCTRKHRNLTKDDIDRWNDRYYGSFLRQEIGYTIETRSNDDGDGRRGASSTALSCHGTDG